MRAISSQSPTAFALTLCFFLTLAQQQTAIAGEDWSMFRGDAGLTGVAASKLPDKLAVLWKFEIQEPITSTAAIVDGVVYFGADDGKLYALDLSTGKKRWQYEVDEGEMIRSSPTVHAGIIFVGDSLGVMHAVDAATGKKKWTFSTDGEIISSANIYKDRIVFGSYDGWVYSLRIADGTLAWKFETQGRVHGTPGLGGRYALVAGCDEDLHVIDMDTGKSQRKVSLGSVSGASAAVVGSRVYVGTYGHKVLAIDWESGTIIWTFADPDRDFPIMSSAAVTKDAVIVGGRDKRLRMLDPRDGKQIWAFVTKGRIDGSPVLVGNRVLFGSGDGNLYALDKKTGRELWRFESGAPFSASPAVGADRLVIGNEDGVLYCFGKAPRRD